MRRHLFTFATAASAALFLAVIALAFMSLFFEELAACTYQYSQGTSYDDPAFADGTLWTADGIEIEFQPTGWYVATWVRVEPIPAGPPARHEWRYWRDKPYSTDAPPGSWLRGHHARFVDPVEPGLTLQRRQVFVPYAPLLFLAALLPVCRLARWFYREVSSSVPHPDPRGFDVPLTPGSRSQGGADQVR